MLQFMLLLLISRQVVVIDEGNNTGLAEFSNGANIKIQVENNIISVMLVTLPEKYRHLTRGLMGNYNQDGNDDFIPKGAASNIPVDSSKEEIFDFGNTCMFLIMFLEFKIVFSL